MKTMHVIWGESEQVEAMLAILSCSDEDILPRLQQYPGFFEERLTLAEFQRQKHGYVRDVGIFAARMKVKEIDIELSCFGRNDRIHLSLVREIAEGKAADHEGSKAEMTRIIQELIALTGFEPSEPVVDEKYDPIIREDFKLLGRKFGKGWKIFFQEEIQSHDAANRDIQGIEIEVELPV